VVVGRTVCGPNQHGTHQRCDSYPDRNNGLGLVRTVALDGTGCPVYQRHVGLHFVDIRWQALSVVAAPLNGCIVAQATVIARRQSLWSSIGTETAALHPSAESSLATGESPRRCALLPTADSVGPKGPLWASLRLFGATRPWDVSLPTVELSHDELVTLSNALNEVLHGPDAIEEWEFQTRTGATREDAKRLLARLADQVRSAG
jgi:hypothetical protein